MVWNMSDSELAKLADIERLIADACGIPKHNSRVAASMIGNLVRDLVEDARAEEREACARIADDYEKDSCGNDCMGGCADCAWFTARREIAAAIRGRKP